MLREPSLVVHHPPQSLLVPGVHLYTLLHVFLALYDTLQFLWPHIGHNVVQEMDSGGHLSIRSHPSIAVDKVYIVTQSPLPKIF